MPMPYTIEAVNALRHAAATQTSAAEILVHLGWDAAMLSRICRRHGIDLLISNVPTSPGELPNSAPCLPHLARILSKLTERQAQIFRVLQPHARGEQWFKAAFIRERVIARGGNPKTGARSIGKSTHGLGLQLERIGAEYRIETQMGPGGGFRLVLREASR